MKARKSRRLEAYSETKKERWGAGVILATLSVVLLLGTGAASRAQAQTFTILHNFSGSDGSFPVGGLISDSSGNLYGTTQYGGGHNYGTVFELVKNSDGTYSPMVLYSFAGGFADGGFPQANLVMDSAGNLYGTTFIGGATGCSDQSRFGYGCGTVFELAKDPASSTGYSTTDTVLYKFTGPADGDHPQATLIMDSAGNLYGTAVGGGPAYSSTYFAITGRGTVFELAKDPTSSTGFSTTLTVLFTGDAGESNPYAGLVMDSAGNLYGTMGRGGAFTGACTDAGGTDIGCGTVFELAKDSTSSTGYSTTPTVLYRFAGGTADAAEPLAGLILDPAGNVFGTTSAGGANGAGAVFELAKDSTSSTGYSTSDTLLLSGGGGGYGTNPTAGLTMNSAGNLYGTMSSAGANGAGTVFALINNGAGGYAPTVLHSFAGGTADGATPRAGLFMDSAGNLYGTTYSGGANNKGTVFEIAAPVANAGANQTLECAGNFSASATLDASGSAAPGTDTLSYQWTDASGAVLGTTAKITVSAPLSAPGPTTTAYTLTVMDTATGMTDSATINVTVQDTTAPKLTLSQTSLSVVLPAGSAAGVSSSTLDLAQYASASDVCDPNPAISNNAPATFPVGVTDISFTATDHCNNQSATQTFVVQVTYNFSGYLAPVLATGQSLFKSGRTIPVQFQLTAADGTIVTNAVAALSVIPYSAFISGSTDFTNATSPGNADTGNMFRFDPATGNYIYNLSTTGFAAGTWLLRATLNDGTHYDVYISIK